MEASKNKLMHTNVLLHNDSCMHTRMIGAQCIHAAPAPQQIFGIGQQIAFEMEGSNYKLVVTNLLIDVNGVSVEAPRAALRDNSAFIFTNASSNPIKIMGQKGYATTQLFKHKKVNFEELGIGGMDKQFDAIFRRAFASRVFPPSIVQRLGIKHVKVRDTARRPCVHAACLDDYAWN